MNEETTRAKAKEYLDNLVAKRLLNGYSTMYFSSLFVVEDEATKEKWDNDFQKFTK
jgi:hypothetical protein